MPSFNATRRTLLWLVLASRSDQWPAFAQRQHEPNVMAVRVNGHFTEVKQPQDQSNSKMGDHLGSIHFVLF